MSTSLIGSTLLSFIHNFGSKQWANDATHCSTILLSLIAGLPFKSKTKNVLTVTDTIWRRFRMPPWNWHLPSLKQRNKLLFRTLTLRLRWKIYSYAFNRSKVHHAMLYTTVSPVLYKEQQLGKRKRMRHNTMSYSVNVILGWSFSALKAGQTKLADASIDKHCAVSKQWDGNTNSQAENRGG